jgi:hypothetical protein
MKLLELYSNKLFGAIRGLDRIRFRGTLRLIANERGMYAFLSHAKVLLKDFYKWAERQTEIIRSSCVRRAEERGIPVEYLKSSSVNKEEIARKIMKEQGTKNGSICMLSSVEPCISPTVKGNKETKKLELHMRNRKCIWIYHYFDHPDYGFGHVRLQTWAPYNINICLNGRHWLEKELIKNNIAYLKDRNCFPWISDISKAQELMDNQLKTNWEKLLNSIVLDMCPDLPKVIYPVMPYYYWSADDTEWATDIMFRKREYLERIYPSLLRYGMLISDSPSVMRYFGKRELSSFNPRATMPREIISDRRKRYEGIRNKHWINRNSIMMYNKSSSILRIETTISNTRDFKVFRRPDDNPEKYASWQLMRKGVSDLHRRCEISDKCNERYADAVCSLKVNETLREVVEDCSNRIVKEGKRYRGLNLWNLEDCKILQYLAKGELAIAGFRNKDLREYLYPNAAKTTDEKEQKRLSGKISRKIKLLRVHGLIRKMPRENRYCLTEKGQKIAATLKCASSIDVDKLMEIAV